MTTAVVLFTRDLRVHDHPALSAACETADVVVPLFVFDDAVLASGFATPNRLRLLLDALHDLSEAVAARGSSLVVRRGRLADVVADVLRDSEADALHLSRDWSRHARAREEELADLCTGVTALTLHAGHLVHDPGDVVPTSGGDAFRVFTPYWRRWRDRATRPVEPAPSRIPGPHALPGGGLPSLRELTTGAPAALLQQGGEVAGRERVRTWFEGGIDAYRESQDRMADTDGTSRLSADLHLGTVSANEVAGLVDRRDESHVAFLRQLCWREFHHQLLASRPSLVTEDWRPQGDVWRDDPEALEAWQAGRTGYPVVDAGMRQLVAEGFMHNRARLVTASFLTKHLRIDWRLGARHFADHLADGDVANNWVNWQWVAGTGTDSRPNRMLNPVTQGRRHDPDGTYVRRWVPELASEEDPSLVHEPWRREPTLLTDPAADYPRRIVDHDEARARFLSDRGVT